MGKLDADTSARQELPPLDELDKRITVAADFLNALDRSTKTFSIIENGKISGEGKLVIGGDLFYANEYSKLLQSFEEGNRVCAEQFSKEDGVIDAKVVNGCVVVVYDSSQKLPLGFTMDMDRGDHSGPTSFWTSDSSGRARQMNRLGLITIDLNKEKRKDGVEPSISLQHELAHHNISITDYLISQDKQVGMESAYRTGRAVALYGDAKDRMTTDLAFQADLDIYSALLGREPNHILARDIDHQLGYLDELHSSALQRKEEWFNASETVYNNRHVRGLAWEVVGENDSDKLAVKKLLALLQVTYLCEKVTQQLGKQYQQGEGQKWLVESVPKLIDKICAIVGASRTVSQAVRLAEVEWQTMLQNEWTQKLINSPGFVKWREEIYRGGWKAEGLEELFDLGKAN